MHKDDLYKTLSDRHWHSGQALAERFNVSRTIIWKQVARLRESGIAIEASQGKGYRLAASSPVLFMRNSLVEHLSPEARAELQDIVILETTSSTNDECLRRVADIPDSSEAGRVLVLAEQQSSGRGRRGKRWVSPYAASLYMSLSQRFEMGAAGLSGLSLVVGIAVAQAIEQFFDEGAIGLKWPNDIYIDGKKLGGILLEVVGDISGPCHAVIGVGINIGMPEHDASAIDQPFTTLAGACPEVRWDKNQLVAAVVNRLHVLLKTFGKDGFEPFIDDWSARDFMRGQSVMLRAASGGAEFGVHCGVNREGALLVETAAGVKVFAGGEVSLRPANL